LKKQDKEVFTREADILRSLSLTQHNHLHLTLLATYEQHGRFYIMFPLAESNLEQYWTNNPGPHREDVTRAKWLFEQSVGIANALSTVHRYFTNPKGSYLWHASHTIKNAQGVRNTVAGEPLPALFGRHGDIKPSNILVFMNQASTGGYGNLKITDFGITRFSTDDRRSVIEGGRITNSAAYRSPECDLPKGNVSTACDVWALGCIYLMLITWFSRGKHSINLFLSELQEKADWYETECFFSTYHNALDGRKKARVKSCVTKVTRSSSHKHDPLTDFEYSLLTNFEQTSAARKSSPSFSQLSRSR
jgi:serine/threonine protein kinase